MGVALGVGSSLVLTHHDAVTLGSRKNPRKEGKSADPTDPNLGGNGEDISG